jgi:hypothetical protein
VKEGETGGDGVGRSRYGVGRKSWSNGHCSREVEHPEAIVVLASASDDAFVVSSDVDVMLSESGGATMITEESDRDKGARGESGEDVCGLGFRR